MSYILGSKACDMLFLPFLIYYSMIEDLTFYIVFNFLGLPQQITTDLVA